jgi:hypothetical protein
MSVNEHSKDEPNISQLANELTMTFWQTGLCLFQSVQKEKGLDVENNEENDK